jgi:hypothetical protein
MPRTFGTALCCQHSCCANSCACALSAAAELVLCLVLFATYNILRCQHRLPPARSLLKSTHPCANADAVQPGCAILPAACLRVSSVYCATAPCEPHPPLGRQSIHFTCRIPAGVKPGARRQKGQTLAEWEAAEGGPVKESLVGMAAVKRALRRKQQRGESMHMRWVGQQSSVLLCKATLLALAPGSSRSSRSFPASCPSICILATATTVQHDGASTGPAQQTCCRHP